MTPMRMGVDREGGAAALETGWLELDLDIHARRELEAHERVHCLRGRVEDVDQALVRPDLELLPRVLVDVRASFRGATLLAKGCRLLPARVPRLSQ